MISSSSFAEARGLALLAARRAFAATLASA